MNDLPQRKRSKPEIPEGIQKRWQSILDAFAGVTGVSAALITRADPVSTRVILSSHASGDSGQEHNKTCAPDLAGYCARVMRQRTRLLVTGVAGEDQPSSAIPDQTYYLGYPLTWPDHELFGTICIYDRRDNPQAEKVENVVLVLREMFERELLMIAAIEDRERLLAELAHHRSHLEEMVAAKTASLQESANLLAHQLRFEELAAEISARLVNVSPERVLEEICDALEKIRLFFGCDHCGILEILSDRRQVFTTTLDCGEQGPGRQENIDLRPFHPWFYSQIIEQHKEVVFSSLDSLPAEAATDRSTWESVNVHSACFVPVSLVGKVTHMIGLWNHSSGCAWPSEYVGRLRLLGEIFRKALAHKSDQESLIHSERMLTELQRLAHVGSWEWDIAGGQLRWSEEVYRIFGLTPREYEASYEAFLARVHPEDRGRLQQAVDAALADPRKGYDLEHRVIRPDGSARAVYGCGEVSFDKGGKPVRMIGTVLDLTEQKRTEQALSRAMEELKGYKNRLEEENVYLRHENIAKPDLESIVGQSDAIRYAQFRIEQVARTKMTVLLTGETGTGKGVFAAVLHEASDRKGKPFVHVNCAGLPPNLIESELFGREKGAFTGASARQIGRFELAHGGTIYLDEIGELPLEVQAKLLKVIESGEFERLGSPRSIRVDVRIVASTNKDLEQEVKMGRFRRDLFYRLDVFPITIPPLNKRIEDIPLLVRFYLDKFRRAYKKQTTFVPEHTMKALQNYDWPGNVRELINVVERAVLVSDGPMLQLAERIDSLRIPASVEREFGEARESLAEMERVHILKILRETGWKIEGPVGAAATLRMKPSTLRARMKKLRIRRPNGH